MITLEAVQTALRAAGPYSRMDDLVRAEMAVGRKVAEIIEQFRPIVDDALDTPGLTSNGEEALLGTLDALTGDCHRDQCYYDTPSKVEPVVTDGSRAV